MASDGAQPPPPVAVEEAKTNNSGSNKSNKGESNTLTLTIIGAIVAVLVFIGLVFAYIFIGKDDGDSISAAISTPFDLMEVERKGVYDKTAVIYKGFIVDNTYFEPPEEDVDINESGNWFNGFHLPPAATAEKTQSNSNESPAVKLYQHGRAAVFLNIPYVNPPIGKLEFAMPKKMSGADYKKVVEQREFKKFGHFCPQSDERRVAFYKAAEMRMSLDCLTLNVFTPANSTENSKLPVYALVHGGSLTDGNAADYGVRGLVEGYVSKGIVVVTINYRLGAYGFFKFSSNVTGSSLRGLYDQIEALKWIQENIEMFGGDTKSVTIGGFSAGACSVALLALAAMDPKNKKISHLFDKVITQSGDLSTCSEGSFIPRTMDKFKKALCNAEGDVDKCVKSKEMTKILKVQNQALLFGAEFDFPDGLFDSIMSMKDRAANDTEPKTKKFFMGVDREEIAVFDKAIGKLFTLRDYGSDYVLSVLTSLQTFTPSLKNVTDNVNKSSVMNDYFENAKDSQTEYYASMEFLTDLSFGSYALCDAKYFKGIGNEIYLYKFEHRGDLFVGDTRFAFSKVVPHGASFLYAAQPEQKWLMPEFLGSTNLANEVAVARNIQNEFSNFIRGGKPGIAPDEENPLAHSSLTNSTVLKRDGFMKKSSYDILKNCVI